MNTRGIFRPARRRMRAALTASVLAALTALTAFEGTARAQEPPQDDEAPPPPLPEDLRSGHFFISLGGGAWVPSVDIASPAAGFTGLDAGGQGRLTLGIGVGRSAVLSVDGGVGYAPSSDLTCTSCEAVSLATGLGMEFHLGQAFALDPWIRYGVAYRHTWLQSDTLDETTHALDFARIGLGADYYPTPAFGFGPYLQTDIGVRLEESTSAYALFHIGLRLSFDPMRAGTQIGPANTAKLTR